LVFLDSNSTVHTNNLLFVARKWISNELCDLAKSRKSLDLTKLSQPFTTNIFLDEDMVPPDNEEIQA